MLENAYYSVISPEGCATILFKDAARGAAGGRGAAHRPRPTCCGSGSMDAVVPEPDGGRAHRPRRRRRQPQGGDRRRACASCCRCRPTSCWPEALRPLPRVRRARPPAGTSADPRRAHERPTTAEELIESSGPRRATSCGGSRAPACSGSPSRPATTRSRSSAAACRPAPASAAGEAPAISGHLAPGTGRAWASRPGARGASGAFAAIGADEGRTTGCPCSRRWSARSTAPRQPGAKPFVEEGDVVEIGQTVCIVEAMKLMNEVARRRGRQGRRDRRRERRAGRVRAGADVPRARRE